MSSIISIIKTQQFDLKSIVTFDHLRTYGKIIGIKTFDELNIVKYVYKHYKSKLESDNLLDFDDLLLLTLKLLESNEEVRSK
jgi:superfamily I DNA/RNA helicase